MRAQNSSGQYKVDIAGFTRALEKLGIITAKEVRELGNLATLRQESDVEIHPLVWLAGKHLRSAKPPNEELSVERLTMYMAHIAKLPYFRIDPLKIDVDAVTGVLSKAYAMRYHILPVLVTKDEVVFATSEPFNREWQGDLQHVIGKTIRCVVSNPLDIARYQEELFGLSHSLRKANEQKTQQPSPALNNVEALIELGRSGKLDANDSHIINIVDWILQYAFEQRASDIHIEPRRENGQIRFRIDGDLHNVYEMPTTILVAIISRIKALGRMDIIEKRRPQDGRVKSKAPSGSEVELRLSTMPTVFGEKMVMRIFDPDMLVSDLAALGFSDKHSLLWEDMIHSHHGLILVTGPTGSGKTTTLYSTLQSLYRPERNICTVEDPIEMVAPEFNQMQVNSGIGLTFASGIRTLLRQDPDIIMVGEIRDLETAEMALQAALTGHLVISTLHTNDTAAAVTRLLELGIAPYLINATLIGVVAQRLVRKLCNHCKAETTIDEDTWNALAHPWKLDKPATIATEVGCDECRNTGFNGRVGIYEMLRITPAMRTAISSEAGLDVLRQQAVKEGVEPLRINGLMKVQQGVTTYNEIMRVTPAFGDL